MKLLILTLLMTASTSVFANTQDEVYANCVLKSGQENFAEQLDDRIKDLAIDQKISYEEAEVKVKSGDYYKLVVAPVLTQIVSSCNDYASKVTSN